MKCARRRGCLTARVAANREPELIHIKTSRCRFGPNQARNRRIAAFGRSWIAVEAGEKASTTATQLAAVENELIYVNAHRSIRGIQFSMKFILAATDGSDGAECAVAVAADLVKSIKGKLLIVNVSEDKLSGAECRQLDRLRVSEGDALQEISQRILAKARAIASDRGVVNVETMNGAGDPAKVLIEIANIKHADAIVVGRRAHGQLEGLLLGSVSQKLSCVAPCAVIVIP